MIEESTTDSLLDHDMKMKVWLYAINDLAYDGSGFDMYCSQMQEREAFVVGDMVRQRMIRRHLGLIGKRILEIITDSFGSSNT